MKIYLGCVREKNKKNVLSLYIPGIGLFECEDEKKDYVELSLEKLILLREKIDREINLIQGESHD